MSTTNRYSIIRQTRSRVRAAEDNASPNLAAERDSLEEESLSRSSFEPSIIDVEGGDKIECGGCGRPNNAELYMVQCRDCSRWYHLSCANVRQSTVQKEVFVCSLCVPRIPIKQPSSVTSRTTNSSVRQARIARELERLEEEKQLMEKMHREEQAQQEKARKEKYDLEKQYLAKKFDLLMQQDEQEGSRKSSSHRSQQSRHDNVEKVQNWIKDVITITDKTGFVEQSSEVLSHDAEQELVANPIVATDVHASSTPVLNRNINTAAGMVQPAPIPLRFDKSFGLESIPRTTESMAIGETAEEDSDDAIGAVGGSLDNPNAQIVPFVDVGYFNTLLHDPAKTPLKTGTLPKIIRNQPSYEQWRSRIQEDERKHREENNVRRKRELELVNQLNRLKMQRNEDLQKQRELEHELQRREQEQRKLTEQRQCDLASLEELQRREQERIRLSEQRGRDLDLMKDQLRRRDHEQRMLNEQRQRELSERDLELERLVRVEQEYKQYMEAYARQQQPSPSLESEHASQGGIPQHPGDNSILDWNSHVSQSTPVGMRTPSGTENDFSMSCGSIPSFRPYHPQNQWYPSFPLVSGPPMVNTSPPRLQIAPASHQIAARQVISRELPIFAGDPIDWPLFISSYNHSTQACGYSDSENLLRLQKCLKGSAKEAVSSFLLHPSTVTQVIATLKLLYGRPEQIVQSLINKVRSTPAPKNDRLDTLVSFGLVVQNLCGHLKAIGLQNHLSNPILLQELVEKLPTTVKFNWALYQQQHPAVDLSTFGEYMANVVSATSGVVSWCGNVPKVARDDRTKGKDRAYINAHSQPEASEK